ncbi:MAG: hypothetical protein LBU41_04285 [Clostridiales Family XIII bacterium]|nr:hypothetical protein [Clostridiales Family XIII bacterium]
MLQNNKFNLVLSILIAIALWAYVVLAIDPVGEERFTNIPVNITNADALTAQGLAIDSEDVGTVTVTVTGNRSELVDLKEEHFKAVADVQGLTYGNHHVTVTVAAPLGLKVTDVKPTYITISVVDLSEADDKDGAGARSTEKEK